MRLWLLSSDRLKPATRWRPLGELEDSAERLSVVQLLKMATLNLSTTEGRSADPKRLSREGHLAAGFNLPENLSENVVGAIT
jgi:hypothetical protein